MMPIAVYSDDPPASEELWKKKGPMEIKYFRSHLNKFRPHIHIVWQHWDRVSLPLFLAFYWLPFGELGLSFHLLTFF